MSRAPFVMGKAESAFSRAGLPRRLVDAGDGGERGGEFDISREAQDHMVLASQIRALSA